MELTLVAINSLNFYAFKQWFGSGSGRIRIIWSDPDPYQYQEALIWIRVARKDYSGKSLNFLKFLIFVTFRPVSEYLINIVYRL